MKTFEINEYLLGDLIDALEITLDGATAQSWPGGPVTTSGSEFLAIHRKFPRLIKALKEIKKER